MAARSTSGACRAVLPASQLCAALHRPLEGGQPVRHLTEPWREGLSAVGVAWLAIAFLSSRSTALAPALCHVCRLSVAADLACRGGGAEVEGQIQFVTYDDGWAVVH